jgi:hypothetical protein
VRVCYAIERLAMADSYRQACAALQRRFKVSPRTAERDLARAYERIGDDLKREAPHLRARVVQRLLRLSRRSETAKDFGAAIRALGVLAKVCGLVEQRVAISTDPVGAQIAGMTPAAQAKELKLLLEELAAPAPLPSPPPQPHRQAFDPRERGRRRS